MFSKTAGYALRAAIYIAQKSSEEKKLGLDEIARAIGSPRSFTAKILQQLTGRNNIISSARGPNGGFYISAAARNRPVLAILKAVGEEEVLTRCVMGLRECSEKKQCPMHAQYKLIKNQLIGLFETTTIQRLAEDIDKGGYFINNSKRPA